MRNGVPLTAIIEENQSGHTRDNAFLSREAVNKKEIEIKTVILSISLDTFSTQKSKQVWNQLSEMEQISTEYSEMDICSILGIA